MLLRINKLITVRVENKSAYESLDIHYMHIAHDHVQIELILKQLRWTSEPSTSSQKNSRNQNTRMS